MSLDDRLIKKAYNKVEYSLEEIEHLKACAHPDTGPSYFMENFLYVQHPTKGKMKFKAFGYQKGLLETYHNYRYSIAMVSRQMGKSTVAAAYLLWYAMFISDSFILVASKTGSDSKEIMQRIRYAYENLPDYIRAGVKSYNKQSIEFDNDSRIVSVTTTENTGRGLSITLIYLDEFAFVPPLVARELWTSISPTLSTGGKCIITSTPNTDEDQFAELWFDAVNETDAFGNETNIGKNGFKSFLATWGEHPERDEKWANDELMKIGDERFRREHMCFVSDTNLPIMTPNGTKQSMTIADLYNSL